MKNKFSYLKKLLSLKNKIYIFCEKWHQDLPNWSFLGLCLITSLINVTEVAAQNELTTAGADLSYQCLGENNEGKNKYRIFANLYYYCSENTEISNPPQLILNVSSASLGSSFNLEHTLCLNNYETTPTGFCNSDYEGVEITPLCPTHVNESYCNGGSNSGLRQYTYSNEGTIADVLKLPPASDWVISINELYRSIEIDNLEAPEDNGLYVEATINNINNNCYSSPSFGSPAVPYYCEGVEAVFNQAIIQNDASLDYQLVYRSVTPLQILDNEEVMPLIYKDGLSLDNPLHNSYFEFDTLTGVINFFPEGSQIAAMAIVVEITDANGTKLGSVMRDINMTVIDCSNEQIDFCKEGSVPNYFSGCVGETLNFSFEICDEDNAGQELVTSTTVIDQAGNEVWSADNGTTGTTFSLNETWTAPNQAGNYTLLLEMEDGDCPYYSTLTQSFPIVITDDVLLTSSTYTYCVSEELDTLVVDVIGCGPFIWDPEPIDIVKISEQTVGIVPDTSTSTYTVSNAMGDFSSFTIDYLNGFDATLSSSATVICEGDVAQLSLQTNSDCTVQWESLPLDATMCADCLTPNIQPSVNTIYTATLICNNGCKKELVMEITVDAYPDFTLTANPKNVFAAQSTTLKVIANENIQADTTAWIVNWEDNFGNILATENGLELEVIPTESPSQYTATVQTAGGCSMTQQVSVSLKCEFPIPTAFSPNNDGMNDEFGIAENINIESESGNEGNYIRVFNRWGEVVFESKDIYARWNGSYKNNTNDIASSGLYVYVIEYQCNGKKEFLRGTVSLLR